MNATVHDPKPKWNAQTRQSQDYFKNKQKAINNLLIIRFTTTILFITSVYHIKITNVRVATFPWQDFSLALPWLLVKSVKFHWQLSNSLTFQGFCIQVGTPHSTAKHAIRWWLLLDLLTYCVDKQTNRPPDSHIHTHSCNIITINSVRQTSANRYRQKSDRLLFTNNTKVCNAGKLY